MADETMSPAPEAAEPAGEPAALPLPPAPAPAPAPMPGPPAPAAPAGPGPAATAVLPVPEAPARPRFRPTLSPRALVAIGGVLVMLTLIAAIATSGGDDPVRVELEAFSDHGLSFTYPSTLQRLSSAQIARLDPSQIPTGMADPAEGGWGETFALGSAGLVFVYQDSLPLVVDDRNVSEYAGSLRAAAGADAPRIRTSTVDRLPAVATVTSAQTSSGVEVQSRTTEVFSGSIGYVLECRSPAEHRAELTGACNAILRSMEIEPRRATSGWSVVRSSAGDLSVALPLGWETGTPHGRHAPDIEASLTLSSGDRPVMHLAVTTDRLRRAVPTEAYASAVRNRYRLPLIGRSSIRLPAGRAVVLRFADRRNALVSYVLATGRTGISVSFALAPGDTEFALFRPTLEQIARTLDVR